jgi:hypothetical protein
VSFIKRKFLKIILYPFISKKFRGYDFLEANYSSRESITKEYIFFDKVHLDIFTHFVKKAETLFYEKNFSPNILNKVKKIEDCSSILIIGTDYLTANVLLVEDFLNIQAMTNGALESIYFKPHPRDSKQVINSLKNEFKVRKINSVSHLLKEISIFDLPICDIVLTPVTSSLEYFCNQGGIVVLSPKASKIWLSEAQFDFYNSMADKRKYKVIVEDVLI